MTAVGDEAGVDARRYSIDLRKQAFPYYDVVRSCRELARMFMSLSSSSSTAVLLNGNWRTKPRLMRAWSQSDDESCM